MGFMNWFQDRWVMMMRTKPYYISILGRKRSSIKSPSKFSLHEEGKPSKGFGAFICTVTVCCSVSYGALLVLSEGLGSTSLLTHVVALAVAGIVAISGGLCLAEYINSQSQEAPSIYSCCYQYSSEVFAFFTGWIWIMSQTAVIAAICKVLTIHVNNWTDDAPRKFLEGIFHDYAKDVPSLIFVLMFVLFILTGFGETVIWYVLFIPIAFLMAVAVAVIGCIMSSKEFTLDDDNLIWSDVEGIDKILARSALCILFFSGPQSILRIPSSHMRRNTTAVLGPLNAIILIISFVFIIAASFTDKTMDHSSSSELYLISNILCTISLCSLGIEAFYPLHFAIEDMSSDGLLFRNFSKKWKPFCFPVASAVVHVISFVAIGVMTVFVPLLDILNLAVIFPLLVNSIVPLLVLTQRYRDNNSWQYEPMFHTSAKNVCQDRSRKKSHEFQYSSSAPGFDITEEPDISTACLDDISDTSSDTDIDSVVEQYKDQNRIANMAILEDPLHSSHASEPTPTTTFRARFCIVVLIGISLIVSITLNFADPKDHFSVLIIALICVFFSTIVQGLLICLPQNQNRGKERGCCRKMPNMPWTPGMASLISSSLLLHSLIQTWKVFFGWFVLGTLLYFLYGMRSSTAANSFYNMRTTHITLRPLPSYGNNCIPQIVPSQRKSAKSRKLKKSKSDT